MRGGDAVGWRSEKATAAHTTPPCRRRQRPGAAWSSRRRREAAAAVSPGTRRRGSTASRCVRRRCASEAASRRRQASSDRSSTAARSRPTAGVGNVDCVYIAQQTRCSRRRHTSPPVPPPGDLNLTSDWCRHLANWTNILVVFDSGRFPPLYEKMTSSTNPNISHSVRVGPNCGHR